MRQKPAAASCSGLLGRSADCQDGKDPRQRSELCRRACGPLAQHQRTDEPGVRVRVDSRVPTKRFCARGLAEKEDLPLERRPSRANLDLGMRHDIAEPLRLPTPRRRDQQFASWEATADDLEDHLPGKTGAPASNGELHEAPPEQPTDVHSVEQAGEPKQPAKRRSGRIEFREERFQWRVNVGRPVLRPNGWPLSCGRA